MSIAREHTPPSRLLEIGCIVVSLSTLIAAPAEAWWGQGHSHITSGAIDLLPQPLGSLFAANEAYLRFQSATEPQLGAHYIDIDYYPEFFAGTFPHDIDDLVAVYGWSIVIGNGAGPWTYESLVNELSSLMQSARTHDDWLDLLKTAGNQAHYIEDLHNPLHLTLNYNGQLTGNNGIHARYEGEMIARHIGELTFDMATATHLPSVIDSVFDEIDENYYFVDDIIDADDFALATAGEYDEAYYSVLWNETGAFTQALFQQAAQAVADGWYTAWVNAGSPIPNLGVEGDYNGDNVVDAADYTAWRNAMGDPLAELLNDPSPESISADDYFFWKSRYGDNFELGVGAGGIALVPEPSAAATASVLAALWGVAAARSKRQLLGRTINSRAR